MAISITRLSGGNTPADGSDPRTFPAIWNATATTLEANVGEGGGSITVSPTAPTDPAPASGDLWWNSTEGELYVYYNDGTSSQWVAAAGPSVTVAATAPTGYEGQLWLDSTDGSMYVYYTDPGGGNAQWIGAVSRSGGILQVVSTTKTDTFSASVTAGSSSPITGLTVSITPSSTSSKILVLAQVSGMALAHANPFAVALTASSSKINIGDAAGNRTRIGSENSTSSANESSSVSLNYLHSPGTTSTITYGVDVINRAGSTQTQYVNRTSNDTGAVDRTRSVSNITLMEVAG